MTALRLLTFTTLFPNAALPNHGVFVANRLRHLIGTRQVTATVLAPIAWRGSKAAPREDWLGMSVLHPRWTPVPGIGMRLSPWLLYIASARALARLIAQGRRFDAIDAHYFYPDGVAAVWLGRRFGLPVVVTARGSDVTQFPEYAVPRRLIQHAARDADAIITVSNGLRDAIGALGIPLAKITVLRNGVDLSMFQPQDPAR